MRNRLQRIVSLLALVACALTACTSSSVEGTSPSSSSPAALPSSGSSPPPTNGSSPSTPAQSHLAPGLIVRVPRPSGLVAAFGAIWAQSRVGDTLMKISPGGQVLARMPHASTSPPLDAMDYNQGYVSLAAGLGSVWSAVPGAILRIDPASAKVAQRIAVPTRGIATTLAVGLGAVWVTDYSARLFRIDPQTGTVSVASRGVLASPSGLAVAGGFVWIPEISEAGGIVRFDPRTGQVRRFEGNAYASFVTVSDGEVWLGYRSGEFGTIDAAGHLHAGPMVPQRLGALGGITTGLDRVFANAGSLVVIDAQSGSVRVRPGVSRSKRLSDAGIAVLGHRVWMADPIRGQIRGIAILD
jgi:hypothetical protein